MPNASTSFFGWVYFLLQKYGMLAEAKKVMDALLASLSVQFELKGK